jgi:hypothetical protein
MNASGSDLAGAFAQVRLTGRRGATYGSADLSGQDEHLLARALPD